MKLCVIGLSSFGYEVASTLANKGVEVLAVDKDQLKVESIRDKVTQAICIDIDNEEALRTVGVDEMDTVIICLGKNFEDAVLLTRLIKEELHVPQVITRTSDYQRQEILEIIGADDVILPEKEVAKLLANKILSKFPNQIQLSDEFSIISVSVPEEFINQTIEAINFPESRKLNCIGIMRGEKMIPPKNNEMLQENDIIYVSGKNKHLANLLKL